MTKTPYSGLVAKQHVDWPIHPHTMDYARAALRKAREIVTEHPKSAVATAALAGLVAILANTDLPSSAIQTAQRLLSFKGTYGAQTYQALEYPSSPADITEPKPHLLETLAGHPVEQAKENPPLDPNQSYVFGPPNPPR